MRGTTRIWRTMNGAGSWSPISPVYGGSVSAIGSAASDANVLYAGWFSIGAHNVGSGPAQLRYTTNGGTTWTDVGSCQLPDRYITDIAVDPVSANDAIVTFSGFGTYRETRAFRCCSTSMRTTGQTSGGCAWTERQGP